MIHCENNLCVFCDDGVCVKENIKLNPMGVCKSLIRINLCDDMLEQIKPELRKKAEELEVPSSALSNYESMMGYLKRREEIIKEIEESNK